MSVIKTIGLLAGFRDVRKAYKEETGKDKPGWASRRFIGAMVVFAGAVAQALWGVKIDGDVLTTISGNLGTLAGAVQTIIPIIVPLYGALLSVVGAVKKSQT
jgi:hypothetical protein